MSEIREPRVRILLEQDGTTDLLEYDIQTDNRDRVRWDLIRGRKNWPQAGEAASLWMTVLAWNALRRSGIEVGDDPEKFIDRCVGVYGIDAEGNLLQPGKEGAESVVDPTRSGADTGS